MVVREGAVSDAVCCFCMYSFSQLAIAPCQKYRAIALTYSKPHGLQTIVVKPGCTCDMGAMRTL